jgi:hypothetical protein
MPEQTMHENDHGDRFGEATAPPVRRWRLTVSAGAQVVEIPIADPQVRRVTIDAGEGGVWRLFETDETEQPHAVT